MIRRGWNTAKDDIVTGNRIYLMMLVSVLTLFVLAACNEKQIPTQVPTEFHPTPADAVQRSEPTDTTVNKAETTASTSTGDVMAGEQLFSANGCTACHSTGEDTIIGPGLSGVYVRAGERTAFDADGYIEQSIREPGAFVVDGFTAGLMPTFDELSESELIDLVAYLKTLN